MITAVQRKTEYCGARMAAMGSWEIGILERHFRVSGSCYQPAPTTNNAVFRLLVPWPFVGGFSLRSSQPPDTPPTCPNQIFAESRNFKLFDRFNSTDRRISLKYSSE